MIQQISLLNQFQQLLFYFLISQLNHQLRKLLDQDLYYLFQVFLLFQLRNLIFLVTNLHHTFLVQVSLLGTLQSYLLNLFQLLLFCLLTLQLSQMIHRLLAQVKSYEYQVFILYQWSILVCSQRIQHHTYRVQVFHQQYQLYFLSNLYQLLPFCYLI